MMIGSAMQQEYDALMKINTWELVSLPPNRQAIGLNGCTGLRKMLMVLLTDSKQG